MPIQQSAGTITVTIDGTPLTDELAPRLTVALVDGNLNQPDLFSVAFRDPDRQLLAKTNAHIGSKVVLKAFSDLSPGGDLLITGEVTALEVEHHGSGTFTILRGYDESHRLFRGRNSETYQNMTSADVATAVANRAGLTPGQIDATSPVHDWLAQDNCSDWAFLRRLA
jgi:phage protein D